VKRPVGSLTIERLAEDRIVLGDPASCIRQIQRFREALGLGHLIFRVSAPGIPRDAAMRSLDMLTREVLPAFA
jgi:alkanesulfonate monooxygenase SsuD/methylene tetrahydromethanopterin reductase-like flavin-dependent oxidoreductase (luciferase family)